MSMNPLHLTGTLAFLIFGFLGSLHCMGMCAPLSLVFGVKPGETPWARLGLYHLGRVISYSTLGFTLSFWGLKIQGHFQTPLLAWIVAIPLILYGVHVPIPTPHFLSKISSTLLGKLRHISPIARSFAMGLFTPLLPCGFLYGAVLASLQAPSSLSAATWMAAFALGTIPALLVSQSGAAWVSKTMGTQASQIIFRLLAIGGAVFILWMAYFSGNCATCHE